MIRISSEESYLERYAYLILGIICLIVGFICIYEGIAAYFANGISPTTKGLLFTILCLFGGFYGCYYWFRTKKRSSNKA
jgi:uncharacterized membrane protein